MKLFTVIFLLASLVMMLWGKRLARQRKQREKVAATAIRADDFEVRVSGWTRAELETILSKFGALYTVGLPILKHRDERVYTLHWRGGMARDRLAFLVNYLHYPQDVGLERRPITAAARLAPGAFAGLPADRSAILYVPSGDRNFDRVHLRDSAGQAWLVDFGSMECRPVAEARMAATVRALFA